MTIVVSFTSVHCFSHAGHLDVVEVSGECRSRCKHGAANARRLDTSSYGVKIKVM